MPVNINLIIISLLLGGVVSAQVPVTQNPQPGTFTNYSNNTYQKGNMPVAPDYSKTNDFTRSQYNDQLIRQEFKYYEGLKKKQEKLIDDAIKTVKNTTLNYSFPSNPDIKGKEHYKEAFDEFQKMLSGKQELSIKKAVFISENAYYENTLPYKKFELIIDDIKFLCNYQMQKEKLPNSDLAKNMAIYQFFADTIELKQAHKEQTYKHYPLNYDFKDFWGDTIWEQLFVTKLLMTQTGQCHSLPMLYMIIAEEMGAKAWLVYSPNHSYIRFRTGKNSFVNFETTNGMLTSDAFVMQSGFVKAEALANKIYMDTLDKKQTIVHCLLDLAMGYQRKYGYDEFYKQCIDLALQNDPSTIIGHMMKSNYYNALWYYIGIQQQRIGGIPKNEINQAKKIYQLAKSSYNHVKELGYAEMSPDAYQDWLKSVNKEKSKSKYKSIQFSLKQIK